MIKSPKAAKKEAVMRSVWAIAVNTLKQALRLKIAVVFTILLLVLLAVMSFALTGDGTVKGRLQSFVCYGMSLTSLLLCLLTIVVSVYSVASDVEQKQIFTVLTKPVRRFQVLFGKLLGVITLDFILLVLFSSVIYVLAISIPSYLGVDADQRGQIDNEFFTARAALKPVSPDITDDVEKTYAKLERTHQLPAELAYSRRARENYKRALAERIRLGRRAAAPGEELIWKFANVRPLDPNQSLFIRFKYDVSINPPDLQVSSRWLVGDIRQIELGQREVTPIYGFERKDLIRTFYEIAVPADAVADDGYLAAAFFNMPNLNETVVIFPPEDGLELLYKADSFTLNFIRAALLVLFRLIFLASLGLLASSYLSFSVAILLCLVVFFTGTVSGFVIESIDSLGESLSSVYAFTIKPLVRILPQFDRFNPTEFLVSARLLSWTFLARVGAVMVGVKSAVLMLIALVIFGRREIAKVVV